MSRLQPLSLDDLHRLAQSGQLHSGFSPLSEQQMLLLDARTESVPVASQKLIAAWLRQLPCPVLGITHATNATPIVSACDVLLENVAAAEPLLTNIRQAPIAATVLVQLLRATEHLSVPDALTMESLAYATLQAGPEFRRWRDSHSPAVAPAADDGPALLMQRDDRHLTLTLNRPANRNAMSVEMRDALVEALQLVLADDMIATAEINARGKCFSTGGDLREFGTAPDPATAHIVRSLSVPGRALAQCAARVSVRVHGACIGSGIEFPAFAHEVVAAPDAYFQLPELKYGLIPGAGGCVSIARRIGRQRTAWLALAGRRIHADQALAWGLVDRIET